MGVIIKYQVSFPETGLDVSNDLYSGQFILDAAIKAEMNRGKAGCSFEIKFYGLPLEKAKEQYKKLKNGGLHVSVKLGYFDGPFELVMDGVVHGIASKPEGDKLITSFKGFEKGTHALRAAQYEEETLQDVNSIENAAKKLLEKAGKKGEGIDKSPVLENISGELKDITLSGSNILEVLDKLAEYAQAELLVCDGVVRMGKPITNGPYKPPIFNRDSNLAVFKTFGKEIPQESNRTLVNPLEATAVEGFDFTIAGDPKLRPAQEVSADVEEYKNPFDFRVHSLIHEFSMTAGYICKGKAYKPSADDNCRRRESALSLHSAIKISDDMTKKIRSEQFRRPTLEIGKVKTYEPEKHLGTLYYTQRRERTETQPSIRTDVDANEKQLFPNKPIASSFAWHKCGMVVPVYPGMKAVLNHNLNLPNDVLVSGFIWAEQPEITPPKNREGDWWLCLPIDFDTSKPPSDSTKAVNDLIANNGKRMIEVKGLKITVGNDKLIDVGNRPAEGEDDEFLIEHKSGTTFKITSDGALAIEAESISIKGDITIEGNVEIK